MAFRLCPLRKITFPFSFSHLQSGDGNWLQEQGFVWARMGPGAQRGLSWAVIPNGFRDLHAGPCRRHSQLPGLCSVRSQRSPLQWGARSSPAVLRAQALCERDGLCGSLREARDALFALRESSSVGETWFALRKQMKTPRRKL